jgi:hypothetical protein
MAHEAQRKTQNCTIKTLGEYKGHIIDYYEKVKDIIELNYTKNRRGPDLLSYCSVNGTILRERHTR